ncbi:extensin [Iris pallida]|uniref:Extensin n=1 Tax=Iris pallida TaxID=29817 RepID=A0AAX6E804_IRIPA|nr:extensin [Iris pallida]
MIESFTRGRRSRLQLAGAMGHRVRCGNQRTEEGLRRAVQGLPPMATGCEGRYASSGHRVASRRGEEGVRQRRSYDRVEMRGGRRC